MSRLVLTGARVVVGDGTVLEHTTVVVDGDRIASVSPDAHFTGPGGGLRPDDRVVPLDGRTVMPGMVMLERKVTVSLAGCRAVM